MSNVCEVNQKCPVCGQHVDDLERQIEAVSESYFMTGSLPALDLSEDELERLEDESQRQAFLLPMSGRRLRREQ